VDDRAPADLPTAKALGLEASPMLSAITDDVIE
jgi:hypothetical protein